MEVLGVAVQINRKFRIARDEVLGSCGLVLEPFLEFRPELVTCACRLHQHQWQ